MPVSIKYGSRTGAGQLQPGGHIQSLFVFLQKLILNTAKIIYCILTMAAFILQWQSLVVTVDFMACKT